MINYFFSILLICFSIQCFIFHKEKEKVLLEISAIANSSYEQLKDLQLQMQSLIFQDATHERLNNIKKIVDEIESHTLKFQKMNVELNYVQNSYIEGMMPPNITQKDQEIIIDLPRYKRFHKKLIVFCDNVESNLVNCCLFKRKNLFQSQINYSNDKSLDLSTLFGRDKHPQLAMSVVAPNISNFSNTIIVKVDDCMNCMMRFENGELVRVLIKGPYESFGAESSCGPEQSMDLKNKIDYFTNSKFKLFREITSEAMVFLSLLKTNYFGSSLEQNQKFLEWLKSFCGLHSQQCFVCNRILSKNHLPPIRRDLTDFSRVLHDFC